MKNKKNLNELELPQIRQMVVGNTMRIERNEFTLNKMRMNQEEESRKRREGEEHMSQFERDLQRSRDEHDREMSQLREMMNNYFAHTEEDRRKINEDHERRMREFDARLAEDREEHKRWMAEEHKKHVEWMKDHDAEMAANKEKHDQWMKEHEARMTEEQKKHDQWMKDHDAKMAADKEEYKQWQKEIDARIENHVKDIKQSTAEIREIARRFSEEFGSTVGHIVEGLLGPKGHKLFNSAGFDVDRSCKDMCRKIKELNLAMEVDVLSYGDHQAIVTEIKTNCKKKDIDKFLDKMKNFKKIFTEHKDKEVMAAIAAINFDQDAYEYAKGQGILIIHVIDESVFTLDPVPEKSKLQRF